eukprot:866-Heterococcus_DN1.PRE.1
MNCLQSLTAASSYYYALPHMYLEPWHADIFAFLDLRKNHGNELERARDLFYGLWIPDLFMHRVEKAPASNCQYYCNKNVDKVCKIESLVLPQRTTSLQRCWHC